MTIFQGNNLDLLPRLPDASIDAIVTDCPYGLSFMGRNWDKALPDPRTWAECLRVLKPGGHMLAFGAPRLYHRLAVQIEDSGWEIRDCLLWLFGSGFPKSLDVSKAIDKTAGAEREVVGINKNARASNCEIYGDVHGTAPALITAPATPDAQRFAGYGTALKPAYEPILLARKPLAGTVAATALEYGTGGLNIDGCRVPTEDDRSRPPRSPNAIYGGGKGTNQTASGNNPAGRWPANIVLSDDGEPSEQWRRYFYCPKASRKERETGLAHLPPRVVDPSRADGSAGRESPRAGAGRAGKGRRNHHCTVKPVDLMRWCVRLVTPPGGGIVLDPFVGSGSTAVACALEGVPFLGMELDPDYATIAAAREAHAIASRGGVDE